MIPEAVQAFTPSPSGQRARQYLVATAIGACRGPADDRDQRLREETGGGRGHGRVGGRRDLDNVKTPHRARATTRWAHDGEARAARYRRPGWVDHRRTAPGTSARSIPCNASVLPRGTLPSISGNPRRGDTRRPVRSRPTRPRGRWSRSVHRSSRDKPGRDRSRSRSCRPRARTCRRRPHRRHRRSRRDNRRPPRSGTDSARSPPFAG